MKTLPFWYLTDYIGLQSALYLEEGGGEFNHPKMNFTTPPALLWAISVLKNDNENKG